MKIFIQSLSLIFFLAIAGCGTFKQGTTQHVSLSSNPEAARVTLNGDIMGETPLNLNLSRKRNHLISLSLTGYENFQVSFDKKLSKWAWYDLLLGAPIGLIIDHSTGGIYKLTPEQLSTTAQMTTQMQGGMIYLSVVMEADPNWQQIGQLNECRASNGECRISSAE